MSSASSPPVVQSATLHCPNCGGAIQLRGFAHTLVAVCSYCGAQLDTSTPLFQILQTAQNWQQVHPPLPLGCRGKLDNVEWEVIGFQIRSMQADGETYSWAEYVLFNPYQGFRYLSEYQGHWNFIRTLSRLPQGADRSMQLDGRRFRKFQSARAQTSYLLGEFPWRVQLGEAVDFIDYVAPPLLLSAEHTGSGNEITWSLGQYMSGVAIWKAFNPPGSPPAVSGVFENEPSHYSGKIASLWGAFGLAFLALVFLMIAVNLFLGNRTAFENAYQFDPSSTGEPSFVTPDFELKPPTGNVKVNISTDLENNWTYFNFALISSTGHAYNFGREVSYYEGQDSDGHWTEGDKSESVTISSIPAGRYFLRVEPEGDKTKFTPVVHYRLTVHRHVLTWSFFVIALILLAIPVIFETWRAQAFERARWQESDYPPNVSQ
ncbi:MAG: DUF4178 domain-containing protein [Bryobacteraceae bacterium]